MLKMKSVEEGNSLSISVGEKSKHETDSSRSYINSFFFKLRLHKRQVWQQLNNR